ncbi:MAG: hypothetical protein H0W07_06635 [Chloroflexi bacterium]|nr:hypothetical protein [Chloroflexota bacterium]
MAGAVISVRSGRSTVATAAELGPVYQTVFIFEFRDGKIERETAYWSQAFEAPEWRARWTRRQLAEA